MTEQLDLLQNFEGMYTDSDTDIRCYTTAVVRTRTPHQCPGNFKEALHSIPVGSRAVVERALVEGKWSTCYTCEECILQWNKVRFSDTRSDR